MRIALLLLTAGFALNVHAVKGDIRLGSKVDLTCTEDDGNHHNKISLTVREKGPVTKKDIPSVVPKVFVESLLEDQYQLREFEIKGHVVLKPDDKILMEKELNTSFYGGLSYPDIGEGFEGTNAYGSYEETENFRAFTINQSKITNEPDFELYYQAPGFASNAGLFCKGTIVAPETARPGVVKQARYDKLFTCTVDKAKDFEATTFEMNITNLQNPRLISAEEFKDTAGKKGWFVHGKDMDDHVLGKLNDADAQILRVVNNSKATPKTRLVSRYFDECGDFNCFSVELDIGLPSRTAKTVKGSFRYRIAQENKKGESIHKVKSRAAVNCTLK